MECMEKEMQDEQLLRINSLKNILDQLDENNVRVKEMDKIFISMVADNRTLLQELISRIEKLEDEMTRTMKYNYS